MFRWRLRRISVFNGRAFVAAYSSKPFAESKKKTQYPDYCFYEADGFYWCVRVGEIEIPWGFGDNGRGYSANGRIIVSRMNVDATSIDGKGLPFTKEGDIFYLYESEFVESGFDGFAPYMRDRLLVYVREFANRCQANEFSFELEGGLQKNSNVEAFLNVHMLTLKGVIVDKVTISKELK